MLESSVLGLKESRFYEKIYSKYGVISLCLIFSGNTEDDLYGSGYIVVSEQTWSKYYTTPYPFTVPEGEIACASNPSFGREVFFHPKGYTDESYVGIPLNKAAVDGLKLSRLTPNVPHSVKEGADLREAVQIGLRVCDEQEDELANY